MPLTLRYNWKEAHRPEERMTILKSFFRNTPAQPNHDVLKLLTGNIEVAIYVDPMKRFVGYEVGQLGVVWICAKCDQTVTFEDLDKYNEGVEGHYQDHLPECSPA